MYSKSSEHINGEDFDSFATEVSSKPRISFDYDGTKKDKIKGNSDEFPPSTKMEIETTELSFEKNVTWGSESSMAAFAGDDNEDSIVVVGNANAKNSWSNRSCKLGADFPVQRQSDVNVRANLLLASLIDQRLESFAMDTSSRRALRNYVVDNLHRVGVMPKVFGSDEFSSLRYDLICLYRQ